MALVVRLSFEATTDVLSNSTVVIVPSPISSIRRLASPTARRWRPTEAFVLASSDHETCRLENDTLPPVRDSAGVPLIAVRKSCCLWENSAGL